MATNLHVTADSGDSTGSLNIRESLARARQVSSSQPGPSGVQRGAGDAVDCPVPGCTATRAFLRTGIKTHITTKHRDVAHNYPPASFFPPSNRVYTSARSTPVQGANAPAATQVSTQPSDHDWAWADMQELHLSYLLHHSRPRILNHIPKALLPVARDALRVSLARINANPQSFGGWFTFFMFPLWCLRQDKDKSRALQYDTRRKLHIFIAGNWKQLQDEQAHQMNPIVQSAEVSDTQISQDNGEDEGLQRRFKRVKFLASKRELSRGLSQRPQRRVLKPLFRPSKSFTQCPLTPCQHGLTPLFQRKHSSLMNRF